MSAVLNIKQGSALPLPFGDAAWRLESGTGELYLATPDRQRLVRDVAAGDVVAALAPGDATLVLVATAPCSLVPCTATARPRRQVISTSASGRQNSSLQRRS